MSALQAVHHAQRSLRTSYVKLQVEQLGRRSGVFFAKLQEFEATKPGSVEVRSRLFQNHVVLEQEYDTTTSLEYQ